MSNLNLWGLGPLMLNGVVLVALLFMPMRRRFANEDTGDGITHCVLPARPQSVRVARGLTFFGVGAGLSVLIIGLDRWLTFEYRLVLLKLTGWALTVPQDATAAVSHANPILALLTSTYFVCLALTVRASTGRRLRILLHVPLLLVLMALIDTALTVVGVATGWSVSPGSLAEAVSALAIGFLVFVRMTCVTFMLPRPTMLAKNRPRWPADTAMMTIAIGAGFTVVIILLTIIGQRSLRGQGTQLLLSFFVFSGFFTTIALFLFSSRWLGRKAPPILMPPPAIDVIVAAYNEEDMITENLLAIDLAAKVYGGPVHVIVANDGSTDRTVEVVQGAMSHFRAATGEIVHRPNGGIARAYNTALEHSTAAYIVRIDADTLIHEEALANTVRWLPDPTVGQVSALYLPRTDLPESWFHRMRLLECLFGFGFARQGHAVVDGVVCAPGPLAAYRRSVAVEVGGYTAGMNGEDLDFTNKVGRAGYRVVLDPNIVAYEDVPYSLAEFRGQRNRWSRAGIHCFARFSFFSCGTAGPRTWFMFPRLFSTRFTGPLRLLVVIHALILGLLHPAYRFTVLTVGLLYLAASLPTFVVATVLMVRYGFVSKLPWLVAWYPFLVVRRFFVLEGLLSLPTRSAAVVEPAIGFLRHLAPPRPVYPNAAVRSPYASEGKRS